MQFTNENTDGYTERELNKLNAAWDRIAATIDLTDEDNAANASDILTNEWYPGIHENVLVNRTLTRFGVDPA